jgi:hypothetical protein
MEFQRNLYGPRPAQLVDGTQSSQLTAKRGVRLTEERSIIERIVDRTEARMIEDVVRFGSELKSYSFSERKVPS